MEISFKNEMREENLQSQKIEKLIRSTLEKLLGSTSLNVLEDHFKKNSDGADLYAIFWENPGKFYEIMEKIFGPGAEVFIRIIAHELAAENHLTVKPEEFVRLIKRRKCSTDELIDFLNFGDYAIE